jgi:radical SAM superfamily enzyme YgiQ (UPF0313 family)
VLLVYGDPHQAYPVSPYGLEVLRDRLDAYGDAVRTRVVNPFIEALDEVAHLRSVLADFAPDLIGLSVRNIDNSVVVADTRVPPDGAPIDVVNYLAVLRTLVRAAREECPEVPWVAGGAAFTSCPAECLDYLGLDLGIVGAGEDSFARLVGALRGERRVDADTVAKHLSGLPGAICRTPGGFRRTPARSVLRDEPATTPAIAAPYRLLSRLRDIPVAVRTKSGCPLRCAYCLDPLNMRETDRRPVRHVVADIARYADGYGLTWLHLADAEVNLPRPDHLTAVCEALRAAGLGERVTWQAYLNAVPCPDDLIDAMVAAGCRRPSFSLDSFDDGMLRGHGKSFRARHVHDLLGRLLRRCPPDVVVEVGVLLGQPGETPRSIEDNLYWMRHYADRGVRFYYSCGIRVYPHTPLSRAALDPRHLYHGAPSEEPAPPLVDPVVHCAPMPPRELAAYVAGRVGGHPGIAPMREQPWPEAYRSLRPRMFNVGVTALAEGATDRARLMLGAVRADAPWFEPAARAWDMLSARHLVGADHD